MISIHAAREGGDLRKDVIGNISRISIHAAREGGDEVQYGHSKDNIYFNPRHP